MKSRSYSALLLGTTVSGDQFGFAVNGMSPLGLRGALAEIVPTSLLEDGGRPELRPGVAQRWDHRIVDLSTIDEVGEEGWEAVAVFDLNGTPHVLLKRPAGR